MVTENTTKDQRIETAMVDSKKDAVVLVEFFNAHYYKVTANGQIRFIPSVTTKLGIVDKPNLARWRGDLGNREADLRMYEAAQKGTRIHWAYAVMLNSGAVLYDPWQKPVYTAEGLEAIRAKYKEVAVLRTQEEMWAIYKLAELCKRLNPKVLEVEKTVYDLDEMMAGTIDHVFSISEGDYLIAGQKPLHLPGGIYIGDLKSGNYVDDNVFRQLAPYAYCYEKQNNVKVAGALVTHTGSTIKTGIPGLKVTYRPREILFSKDLAAYRHAAALWDADHEGESPETFVFPSLITMPIKETT